MEAQVLEQVLKSATPTFDKKTEDETRFRIYKLGSLEVRTTQEPDGKEFVGVVYSVQASDKKPSRILDSERVVKVTEYVEQARRFYVVLETEQGTAVVTEKLANGNVTWKENPVDLEGRNSLAKVTRTADYRCASITIRALKCHKIECTSSKHYAQGVYSRCLQLSVDSDLMQDEDQEESLEESTTDCSEKEVEQDYSEKKQWMFREAMQFNNRQRATEF